MKHFNQSFCSSISAVSVDAFERYFIYFNTNALLTFSLILN